MNVWTVVHGSIENDKDPSHFRVGGFDVRRLPKRVQAACVRGRKRKTSQAGSLGERQG
jgi:hypothetical protein